MKVTTILFILLFFFTTSYSQHILYKEFGTNEGLPSTQVNDMYQDDDNNIWFATDRGLAMYNGYEITKFGIKEGVLDPVILDFYPQKNGNIYCTTFGNEIFYFHNKFNGFIPYKYNHILKKYLKGRQHIISLYIDQQENLHLTSVSMFNRLVISKEGKVIEVPKERVTDKVDVIYIHLEKKEKNDYFFFMKIDSVPNKEHTQIIKTINKNNIEAILLKDGKHSVFKVLNSVKILNEKGVIVATIDAKNEALVLKPIDENHFFIGYSYEGCVIVDTKGTIINRFLENQSVTDFLIDNEGGYWFSTSHSGVFYCKEPKIEFVPTPINAPIVSLAKNNKNELYISYDTGDVLKLDHQQKTSVEFKSDTNAFPAFVEFDSIWDQLYVHSVAEFYRKDKNNKKEDLQDSLTSHYTLKLSEPSKKGIIILQQSRFIKVGNNKKTHTNTPFRIHDACFWEDEIYLGSPSGVYLFKNEQITPLVDLNPIFKNRVDDLDVNEEKNEIYFASLGAGIIIYDKKTEEVRTITEQDGLFSDIINELYLENENELWVCTNSGLNKVTFTENGNFEITGLKSSNGLLNDGISDVEIMNDTIWIASRKGLIYAPKSLFNKKNKKDAYHLQLKGARVNDVAVNIEKLTELSYQENRVDFLFEGVSFKEAGELLYKYKLEGLGDDNWYYTKHRQVTYSALPYGKYTFKVAATNSEKAAIEQFLEVPIFIQT